MSVDLNGHGREIELMLDRVIRLGEDARRLRDQLSVSGRPASGRWPTIDLLEIDGQIGGIHRREVAGDEG